MLFVLGTLHQYRGKLGRLPDASEWISHLTGQGHHHGDHSIKSTWYCEHKPMNYNASPIMSFVMLCVPSSCCSLGYWREVLRFLTFRHFASVQHFIRDLSCDQRFARAHNMPAEVWWLFLWEVSWFYLWTLFKVSASRSRQEMRLVRQWTRRRGRAQSVATHAH